MGVDGFEGSEATEYFLSSIDRLFDIFNSRTPRATGYKKPLTLESRHFIKGFMERTQAMLLSLETSTGVKVYNSKRSLSVLGFAFNITSLMDLSDRVLCIPSMKYLLTYKLSQDHLELFFSCVRRAGGWNNNPSAKQYAAIHRRLLGHAGVCIGKRGNVLPLDETGLLVIDEKDELKEPLFEEALAVEESFNTAMVKLSPFVDGILEYIAGWVVRKLQQKLKCDACLNCLVDNDLTNACMTGQPVSLLEIKGNGGLVYPSNAVVELCKHAEKVMRATVDVCHVQNTAAWGLKLEANVFKSMTSCLFLSNADHFNETIHGIDSHYFSLVRCIVRTYLTLRRRHSVNMTNSKIKGKSVRQKLTKTVLFKGQ